MVGLVVGMNNLVAPTLVWTAHFGPDWLSPFLSCQLCLGPFPSCQLSAANWKYPPSNWLLLPILELEQEQEQEQEQVVFCGACMIPCDA